MDFASEYIYNNQKNRRINPSPISQNCLPGPSLPEPDTNIISARFDHLVEVENSHAGEPIFCFNCKAVLSKHSKLNQSNENNKKIWSCEFCSFENKIYIEKEEIPTNEETTYILEAANEIETNEKKDSSYLVYCIDISGSMSVTTPVNSNFKLPTDKLKQETLRNLGGEYYQHHPQATRHITRLEAVQVAIDDNLNKMEKNDPEKKVGLVTFNQSVSVLGDGIMNKIEIPPQYLENKNEIKKIAERTPQLDTLKNTNAILRNKLLNLEEGGATALGPALYYSILLASRKAGSQVILCTDGLANRGIGSLEDQDMEDARSFYNELGEYALSKGVSVSIITIEGTSCKLGLLGDISNKTGGMVNVVNPLKLKEQFSSILEEKIIATNVFAELILHKALYVRDHENFDNRQSCISKKIGNVSQETELTFEFSVREDVEIDQKLLPFQLKITYQALNGTKLLRVLTKVKEMTEDKRLAEAHSDRKILAANAIQSNVQILKNFNNKNLMCQQSAYIANIQPIKDDFFSPTAYIDLASGLSRIQNDRAELQDLSELNDEGASNVYNYRRIRTKDIARKSKK